METQKTALPNYEVSLAENNSANQSKLLWILTFFENYHNDNMKALFHYQQYYEAFISLRNFEHDNIKAFTNFKVVKTLILSCSKIMKGNKSFVVLEYFKNLGRFKFLQIFRVGNSSILF